MTANLVLHCGAREVNADLLARVPCPKPEGVWRPVPHCTVLDYATKALTEAGYAIADMRLGLSRDDQRFFGALTLQSPIVEGTALCVGLRSSTDKSLSLGFAYGARTFVCDNLAFRSDKVIAKKHTTHAVDRYFEAICRCVAELPTFRDLEANRIGAMQRRRISDDTAEALLLRLYADEGILSPRTLPAALTQWREPTFPGLEERSAWRLYSAVTFALNGRARTNPQAHAATTIRLGRLLELQDEAPGQTLVAAS